MRFQGFLLFSFIAAISVGAKPVCAATSIPFTINLSENVTVTGTPRIAVDVGGIPRYATYTSGTSTNSLTFTYSMVAGDVDLDGVTLTSPIDLNGATIKDLNGNDAILTYTLPNTSNVKVNYPSLGMDFIYDSDGRYSLNGTVYNNLASFLTATSGSFSRGSTATYFDSSGVMQTAASGVARFDYDPTTLAAKGLLIEESRTNILKQSNAFTTSPWDTITCGGLTATGSNTTAPDGSSVPIYNFSTSGCVFQDVAVTIGNSLTHSVWIKANKAGTLGFRTPGTGAITSSPLSVSTSWQRYSLTATAIAANSRFLIDNRSANGYGVTGLEISFFGGQMEVGTFATSYIPTTAASITRQADDFSIPIASWFNAANGSLLGSGISQTNGTGSQLLTAIGTDTTDMIGIRQRSSPDIFLMGREPSLPAFDGGGYPWISLNVLNKIGIAYTDSSAGVLSLNGAVPQNAGSYLGSYGASYTKLTVGSYPNTGGYWNGTIQKIIYYPARMPDTQLQLLTQ